MRRDGDCERGKREMRRYRVRRKRERAKTESARGAETSGAWSCKSTRGESALARRHRHETR